MVSDRKRKNLLDLEYMTALQHTTTLWVVLFTYLIGVCIALLTRQLDVGDNGQMAMLVACSLIVAVVCGRLLLDMRDRRETAIRGIRSLRRL